MLKVLFNLFSLINAFIISSACPLESLPIAWLGIPFVEAPIDKVFLM